MKKKTAYIVRYYKEIDEVTKEDHIDCYLSLEDWENGLWSWRYNFDYIDNGTPSVVIDSFFGRMHELQRYDYDIVLKNVRF